MGQTRVHILVDDMFKIDEMLLLQEIWALLLHDSTHKREFEKFEQHHEIML
jgi:hypothetical protein